LLAQNAVHAEAYAELFLERLDVNIGRAHLERAGDKHVDEADDRRFAGHVAEMFDLGRVGFVGAELVAVLVFGFFAVETVDSVEDLRLGAERGDDVTAGETPDYGDSLEIERIGHGYPQTIVFSSDRQEAELAHEARGEPLDGDGNLGEAVRAEELDVELFGESGEDVARSNEAEVDQNASDAIVAFLLELKRLLEIVGIEQPLGDQHLAETAGPGAVGGLSRCDDSGGWIGRRHKP